MPRDVSEGATLENVRLMTISEGVIGDCTISKPNEIEQILAADASKQTSAYGERVKVGGRLLFTALRDDWHAALDLPTFSSRSQCDGREAGNERLIVRPQTQTR